MNDVVGAAGVRRGVLTGWNSDGGAVNAWGGRTFAARLRGTDLRALLDLGRQVRYEAGDHLMRQGEDGDCVVVVGSGHVKVLVRDAAGHDRLLGVRGQGELIGEMACVDGEPRSASVVAHDGVLATKIARAKFVDIIDKRPGLAREVVRQVATRLRAAERRQTELTSDVVEVRITRVLAELADVFAGGDRARGAEVRLGQEELGQLAAASHVSAQRALRRLKACGLVRTGYGKVIIPCRACLRAAVTGATRNHGKPARGCGGSATCPRG